ncbi:hypothetical protein [Streptomyces sp. NPDC017230]|uniref:hypothetical protein n=1 Tax=unclassified Streptomyces TaxID=2593676 RepID=UPI0037B42895
MTWGPYGSQVNGPGPRRRSPALPQHFPGWACARMMEGPRCVSGDLVTSGGVMGISLGTRIAGLCLAGTVAVVVASCVADGSGAPRGDRDVSVAGGSSNGGPDGTPREAAEPSAAAPSPPSWRPDGSGGPVGVPRADRPVPVPPPASTAVAPLTPRPAPPAEDHGARPLAVPAWLPPGPVSPDTDAVPDPRSLYDRLRAPATGCGDVLRSVPLVAPTADWRLLRGLANACLAVQGRGGSWETAARDHAELAGRLDGCKNGAAYDVLTGLLEFHRLRPGATVRLGAAPDGAPACDYGIASVDAGPDGAARPGDLISIELRGTYFDHAELLRDGGVFVGGVSVPGPLASLPADGRDHLRLTVTVPAVSAAPGTPVDVRVRYGGTEPAREGAFVLAAPEPPTPPVSVSVSASP